jgi:hypothetical protein
MPTRGDRHKPEPADPGGSELWPAAVPIARNDVASTVGLTGADYRPEIET